MPKMTEEEKNQDSKLMGRKRMQRRLASPLGIFITDNKMKYFAKYPDQNILITLPSWIKWKIYKSYVFPIIFTIVFNIANSYTVILKK